MKATFSTQIQANVIPFQLVLLTANESMGNASVKMAITSIKIRTNVSNAQQMKCTPDTSVNAKEVM